METLPHILPNEVNGLLNDILPYIRDISSLPPALTSISSPPPQDIFDTVMRRYAEKYLPIPVPVFSFLDKPKPNLPDDIPSTPSLLPFRYGCTPPQQLPVRKFTPYVPPPVADRRPIPSAPKRPAFVHPVICEIQPWEMPRVRSQLGEVIRLAFSNAAGYVEELRTLGRNYLTALSQFTQEIVSLLPSSWDESEFTHDPDLPELCLDSIIPLYKSPNRFLLQPDLQDRECTSLHLFGNTLVQTLHTPKRNREGKTLVNAYVWENNQQPYSITFPVADVENQYISDATIRSAIYGSSDSLPARRKRVSKKDADLSEFGIQQVLTHHIQTIIPIMGKNGAHKSTLYREKALAERCIQALPAFLREQVGNRTLATARIRRTLAPDSSSYYRIRSTAQPIYAFS